MTFLETTQRYERWLEQKIAIDRHELAQKNQLMRADAHSFLRGTFYRWAHLWQKHHSDLGDVPQVLGIGDLHVENFGTWRDGDGRLAWGINDFDEAATIPYINDLVRLVTSAILAMADRTDGGGERRSDKQICQSILSGYRKGIEDPNPFVLAERHAWLRNIVSTAFDRKDKAGRSRYERFISQMSELPPASRVSSEVAEILRDAFPKPAPSYSVGHRVAGLGSLGRPRFTAVASSWNGGMIVREVKAITTSAWLWAAGNEYSTMIQYNRIVRAAVRAPDPTLQVRGGWVSRRLAPDVGKVELVDLPDDTGEDLLEAMGRETANVHAPAGDLKRAIMDDLEKRTAEWLLSTAIDMRDRTIADWQELKAAT